MVIQLFIAVVLKVLKHWIRIKPRNGRMVMERGGGHLHAIYQSHDFIYRLHVYSFLHSKRHNFLIMKLFIIVVLIHWIIIMERGLKDRVGRKD